MDSAKTSAAIVKSHILSPFKKSKAWISQISRFFDFESGLHETDRTSIIVNNVIQASIYGKQKMAWRFDTLFKIP